MPETHDDRWLREQAALALGEVLENVSGPMDWYGPLGAQMGTIDVSGISYRVAYDIRQAKTASQWLLKRDIETGEAVHHGLKFFEDYVDWEEFTKGVYEKEFDDNVQWLKEEAGIQEIARLALRYVSYSAIPRLISNIRTISEDGKLATRVFSTSGRNTLPPREAVRFIMEKTGAPASAAMELVAKGTIGASDKAKAYLIDAKDEALLDTIALRLLEREYGDPFAKASSSHGEEQAFRWMMEFSRLPSGDLAKALVDEHGWETFLAEDGSVKTSPEGVVVFEAKW